MVQHTPAGCCAAVQFGHTFRAIKCGLKPSSASLSATRNAVDWYSILFNKGRGGLPPKTPIIGAEFRPSGVLWAAWPADSPPMHPRGHQQIGRCQRATQGFCAAIWIHNRPLQRQRCALIQILCNVRASLSPRPVIVVLHRGLIHRNHCSTDVHAARPGQLAIASPIFIVWPQIHLVRKCFSLTFHAKTQLVAIIMDPLHHPTEQFLQRPIRWYCIGHAAISMLKILQTTVARTRASS